MKHLLSILCLFSFLLCQDIIEEIRLRYDNGNKKLLVKYLKKGSNEIVIERIRYALNGDTLTLENYNQNGQKDGIWKYYNSNGLFREERYTNGVKDVRGCLDSKACNYDSNANIGNNSCIYVEDKIEQGYCTCYEVYDECGVCNGNNSTCTDECGIVNGNNKSMDECGNCDGRKLEYIQLWGKCYNIDTYAIRL